MDTDEPSAAEPQPLWSARTCPRFLQATCRRRMRDGVQISRAAERGPALATSRQSGKSGDKSPHSKFFPRGRVAKTGVRNPAARRIRTSAPAGNAGPADENREPG